VTGPRDRKRDALLFRNAKAFRSQYHAMKLAIFVALTFLPTLGAAETITQWTPEQVEAAKEAAAVRNMKAENQIANGITPPRSVHGEVGIAVGTGGYSSIFGTAVMPLGQNGAVALSFENTQNDPLRYYRRR
jgi:hypothetical protein